MSLVDPGVSGWDHHICPVRDHHICPVRRQRETGGGGAPGPPEAETEGLGVTAGVGGGESDRRDIDTDTGLMEEVSDADGPATGTKCVVLCVRKYNTEPSRMTKS